MDRPSLLPLTVGLCLLLLVLVMGPVLGDPTGRLLGSPCAEAAPHLWGLWTTTEGLFTHGPFLRVDDSGFPGTFREHLMDPVNLVFFAPLYALAGGGAAGAMVGWNGLVAAWTVVGVFGAAWLGRELLPEGAGRAAAVATLVLGFAGASYTLAFPLLGRTEYLPAALVPVHLVLLRRTLRAEARPVRLGLAASLSLGAVALGGWYLALFVALFEVPAALILARGTHWRRSLGRLLLVAMGATACLLPAAWALHVAPPAARPVGESLAPPSPFEDMTFALPDALRLPGNTVVLEAEQAAYVGLVILGLAVVGAVLRRAARPWLATGLGLGLLAMGPFLSWDGVAPRPEEALLLPAGVLEWILPPARAVRSWSRMGGLAPLPLAVAAAMGLQALWQRLPRRLAPALWGLPLLALIDQATWPRSITTDAERTFEVFMPSGFEAVLPQLPPGALLQVPLALDSLEGCQIFGPYLLWTRLHARAVSAVDTPARDGTLEESWLSRSLVQVQRNRGGPGSPRPDRECAEAEAARLGALGFAALLHHDGFPNAEPTLTWLERSLGPPVLHEGRVRAWILAGREPPAEAPSCPLPRLPWER